MLGIAGIALVMALNSDVAAPIYPEFSGIDSRTIVSAASETTYCTRYIYDGLDSDDLANKMLVTKDDMKILVDHYVSQNPSSVFIGCEGAFVDASNLTGLDPLFLFSLAGVESGWGTSEVHIKQGNPYSLGMYGDGKHNGYTVGETFYDGIIDGACYIYEHYYLNGQTTLYSMNHIGDHSYCAGDPSWEAQIEAEIKYCHELLGK